MKSAQTCANASDMERLVGIGEAAQVLGVSITTLRRWEAAGRLSAEHTAGGHRRYDLVKLRPEMFHAEDKRWWYLVCFCTGAWTTAFAWLAALNQLLDNTFDPISV